ncbi:MAG: ABC transporter ATP-binding protein [Eubacteriales bacterium]|nr:ABC transporter ATP-binding protein [Eubacteriales bacterium]
MLEFKGVTKQYGSKTAVNQVSLKLEPGKIYAMLGPNGSGKTTLMKMSVGLVKPNKGEIYYNNQLIGTKSRKEIAYMSTEPYFYNWMTVKDVGKYYEDFFEDYSAKRYENLIQRMELGMDMKTKTLSSGMMAKLKIAVTMARKSKVYLLDEPLNGIDLLARDEIIKSVLEAIDDDVTLVISSHLVDELERVVDSAVFMKEGNLAAAWDVEDLRMQQGKSIVDLYREIYGHGGDMTC